MAKMSVWLWWLMSMNDQGDKTVEHFKLPLVFATCLTNVVQLRRPLMRTFILFLSR